MTKPIIILKKIHNWIKNHPVRSDFDERVAEIEKEIKLEQIACLEKIIKQVTTK